MYTYIYVYVFLNYFIIKVINIIHTCLTCLTQKMNFLHSKHIFVL